MLCCILDKQSTVSPSPLGRCCKTSPTSTHPHYLPYYLVALRCLVRSCINICQLCHAFDSHRVPNISWNGLLLHTSFGKLLRCTPKRGLEDDGCPCHACIAFFPQAMILTMNSCLHAQVDLDRLLEAPIAVTKLQIDSQTAIIIKKNTVSHIPPTTQTKFTLSFYLGQLHLKMCIFAIGRSRWSSPLKNPWKANI